MPPKALFPAMLNLNRVMAASHGPACLCVTFMVTSEDVSARDSSMASELSMNLAIESSRWTNLVVHECTSGL